MFVLKQEAVEVETQHFLREREPTSAARKGRGVYSKIEIDVLLLHLLDRQCIILNGVVVCVYKRSSIVWCQPSNNSEFEVSQEHARFHDVDCNSNLRTVIIDDASFEFEGVANNCTF